MIPEAEGKVLKIIQEAEAYKESIIAEAKGKADRFDLLRTQYEIAPKVTRQRMYLETMETVLGDTAKIVMDGNDSNSLMYLPIDQLMKQSNKKSVQPIDFGTTVVTAPAERKQATRSNRNTNRGRGN